MTTEHLRPRLAGAAGALLLGLTLARPAAAGLEEGMAAYEAGDYQTALNELRPLADQGDAQAQFLTGTIYAEGLGTLKHYSLAHTYLTLAANQGITDAMFAKVDIADNLSQRDIIESLKRQSQILEGKGTGFQPADGGAVLANVEAGAAGSGPAAAEEEVAVAQPAEATRVEEDGIDDMSRRDLVRAIQEQLNRLGYSAGTPDGLYGPSTRGAIQGYQRDAGLTADGEATADLLRALRTAQPS